MSNNKCDDCESKNIGYINNDCLCLECGEKINIKKASEVTRQEADKIANILKFKSNDNLRKLAQQTLKEKKFNIPYTNETTSKKGIYLVKDEGIYLMNAFSLAEGKTPSTEGFTIYAEGYDPSTNENVWEDSYLVSGDDFGEFVEMPSSMLVSVANGSDITLMLSAETIELKVVA